MWKRNKESPKHWNPDKVAELELWNKRWDPPGELSEFYIWDNNDLKWVELDVARPEPGIRKETSESFNKGGIISGPGKVWMLSNVASVGSFKESPSPKVPVVPKKYSNDNSIENLVMNARKGIDTRSLDELKSWYGWRREFNVQRGYKEYISVNKIELSVLEVQRKVNSRFGRMYLPQDGQFGIVTANLLWSLENNRHL